MKLSASVFAACAWLVRADVWSDCPAQLTAVLAMFVPNADFSCGNYSVPLDWGSTPAQVCNVSEAPADLCIRFHVIRASLSSASSNSTKKPALWMIPGGPGGSAESLMTGTPGLPTLLTNFDLFFPDHRGVGYSTPLECPLPASFRPDATCIAYLKSQWGDKLKSFSTTNAAFDHAYAMKDVGTENVVYGISYGTYLANRLLLVANESDASYPRAVVLDGVCDADQCRSMATYDARMNRVALKTLPYCNDDDFCRAQFPQAGGSTAAYLTLFEEISLGNNVCAQQIQHLGVNVSTYHFAYVMEKLTSEWKTRPLALAVIYRMIRCDSADIDMLAQLFNSTSMQSLAHGAPLAPGQTPPPLPNGTYYFGVLGYHIEYSELWDAGAPLKDQSCDALYEITRQGLFVSGVSYAACPAKKSWNTYAPDEYVGRFAAPKSTPILLVTGELDPKTPTEWAAHAAKKYQQLNVSAKLIHVPLAQHGAVYNAPIISEGDEEPTDVPCGVYLMNSFLLSRGAETNTSCLSKLAPIDWAGKFSATQQMGTLLLGSTDIWGGSNEVTTSSKSEEHRTLMLTLIVVLCTAVFNSH